MSDYDDYYNDYDGYSYNNEYEDVESDDSIDELSSNEYSNNYKRPYNSNNYNRPYNSNYYNRPYNSNNYNRSYNSNYYGRPYNSNNYNRRYSNNYNRTYDSNNYGGRSYYIIGNSKRNRNDSNLNSDDDDDSYGREIYKRNRYISSSDSETSNSSEEEILSDDDDNSSTEESSSDSETRNSSEEEILNGDDSSSTVESSSDSVVLTEDEDGYNYSSDDFYFSDDSYDGNSSEGDYDDIFSDMNDYEEYWEERKRRDQTEYANMYDLPDKNQRLVIVDTEVSGVTDKDNVIEICAFEMINGKLTGNKYHRFFKPKNHMTDGAIKKHRIPKSVFFNTPFKDRHALIDFLDFVGDSQIIAHNAVHDMEKINNDLINWSLDPIPQEQFNCSMRIFYRMFPEASPFFSSLTDCCQNMGIHVKKRNLHLATYDSYLAGKIMEKIYKSGQK